MAASPYANWQQIEEAMYGGPVKLMEQEQQKVKKVTMHSIDNEIISQVREYLVMEHRNLLGRAFVYKSLRKDIEMIIRDFVISKQIKDDNYTLTELVEYIMQEIIGMGPLEPLMEDDTINEIAINGPYEVYIQKDGRWHLVKEVKFEDEEHLQLIIRKLLNAANATVTTAKPYVDTRLSNSRIQVTIPPVARNGTTVNIRKFPPLNLTEEMMNESGLLSKEMLEFLKIIMKGAANIIIAGGTSSGKTTTLKRLVDYIPDHVRIATSEDTEEMRLKQLYPRKHIVSFECRYTDNPQTNVDLRVLLKNNLRQSPDRIIVGEVRGPEALIMLEAMNTGHDGSISTMHAKSAKDAITRLVQMAMGSGIQITTEYVGGLAANVIDIVIFQRKMLNGKRVIEEIVEVLDYKDGEPIVQPIYQYKFDETRDGRIINGEHVRHPNGFITQDLARKLMLNGVKHSEIEPWLKQSE